MKIQFTAKEVRCIFISALVLGFVFGFDDGREVFSLAAWLANYMLMVVLALGSLIIFVTAQKWAARQYNSTAEHDLWKVRRFGFKKSAYLHKRGELGLKGSAVSSIHLGIILPIIIAFLSEGAVWFAAAGTVLITIKEAHRIGKRFIHLREVEVARIALAGPLACIIISLLLNVFNYPVLFYQSFVKINIAMAISNMLPFPKLAGTTVLFGAKLLYVFSFSFIILAAILMWFLNTFITTVFALALALILMIFAYYVDDVA